MTVPSFSSLPVDGSATVEPSGQTKKELDKPTQQVMGELTQEFKRYLTCMVRLPKKSIVFDL